MYKIIGIISLFLQFTRCGSQPAADICTGAVGPRPISGVSSPASTTGATIDNVGSCGVAIDMPGIWWWVNGTGQVIRASSCDERTKIKVKLSVFTGFCNNLRCVTGGTYPDFECPNLSPDEDGAWGSISTAIDFPTVKGQRYYILVQQETLEDSGTVWMNFRAPTLPQNDECLGAVGPLPKDNTKIDGTTLSASVSQINQGYCNAYDLYPGVWYHVFGTGGSVTVSACGETNIDGIFFSVYNGANCDDLLCVDGDYELKVEDEEKCTFGAAAVSRTMTKFTFNTNYRDRYYIYIHFARTTVPPTGDMRIFVDDGGNGNAAPNDFERPSSNTDGDRLSMLGTHSWDRFKPAWSLTVNDQCLYEFIFQFEHDDTLPMGDIGFSGNCAFMDPVTKLPFVADDGLNYLDPRQHWERFPDYVWASIGFNHLSLDWLPCGHRPKGYSLPHYDFSFFRVPPEFRATQMTCDVLVDEQVIVPGEQVCEGHSNQETAEGMGFFVVPSSLWDRKPVVNMPRQFARPKNSIGPIPHIGLRSWDQDAVPEQPNEWNDLPLFMSSYAGDLAMWQVHVPYRLISGDQDEDVFMSASAQYFETTIQTLPDTYAVKYDESEGKVRFTMVGKSQLCKDDFELAQGFAHGANANCAGALQMEVTELKRGSFNVATVDTIQPCNEKEASHGVWFEVVGNGNIFTLSTCVEETKEPTAISVFSGNGCSSLECTDGQIQQMPTCDYSDVRLFRAYAVSWITNADEVYRVLVAGEEGSESYGLSLSDSEIASNTNCQSAVNMEQVNGSVVVGNTVGSNLGQSCDNNRMSRGVWYIVVSGSIPSGVFGTLLSATTCSDKTSFYSAISIFRGGCGALQCVSDITYIPCQHGVTAQLSSFVQETFYVFVHSDSIAEEDVFDAGLFELRVTEQLTSENDQCANRILLPTDGSAVVEGSTVGAKAGLLSSDCGTPPSGGGVWYSVVGTGSGLRASTCFDETDHATSIHVFSGTCQSLSCIGYEGDGFGCGSQRNAGLLNWISEAGITYYLLVSGKDTEVGMFHLGVSEFVPASNDKCEDSQGLDFFGNTWDSTRDIPFDSFCGIPLKTPGLWYTVDGDDKGISASVCPDNPTFIVALTIFTGSCNALECIAGSDYVGPDYFGPCLSGDVSISWMGEEGKTYYIFVHGAGGGEFALEVNDFEVVQENDFCVQAVPTDTNGTALAGSITDANYDHLYGSAFCGTFIRTSGVWYSVKGTGGPLQVKACAKTVGSSVTLSIFSGTCDNLSCVTEKKVASICSSSSQPSRLRILQSVPDVEPPIAWLTDKDETYYMLVHDQDPNSLGSSTVSEGGDFELVVTIPGEGDGTDICEIYIAFLKKEGTMCTCSQDGDLYTVSCVEQSCLYCNSKATVCYGNVTTGSDIDEIGQVLSSFLTHQFVGKFTGTVTTEYRKNDECDMIVDGEKCNSCQVIGCLEGSGSPSEDGLRLDCENIEVGALADSCTAQALFDEGTLLEFLNGGEFKFCNTGDVASILQLEPSAAPSQPTDQQGPAEPPAIPDINKNKPSAASMFHLHVLVFFLGVTMVCTWL